MYKYLGRLATAHPWAICLAWLSLGLVVALAAPSWDGSAQDDDIRFLPPHCASVRGYNLLQQAFPEDVFASRLILAVEREDRPLDAADLALIDRVVRRLEQLRLEEPGLKIGKVVSRRDPFIGNRLVSADGHCSLVQVSLETPYLAVQTKATVDRAEAVVRQEWDAAGAAAPALHVTGPAGVGRDLTTAGGSSLDSTTLATILLVVVILLFVHRAPLLALIPLITIAGAVFVALKLLALCTLIPGFYLVNISQIFAVVMLYGAGTDYCLFLISRYREELAAGHERGVALERSLRGVGSALTASAATVICGLGLMGLAEFAKVRCGGPAIAISLAVALAASLTLAPALLHLLGPVVFWPTGMPAPQAKRRERNAWSLMSRQVVARPMFIWATAVLVLLPLALLGLRVEASYKATGELATSSSSVTGLAAIQRHFTAGEVGPVTVLLESSTSWTSAEGKKVLRHLSSGFTRLDNVAEVRSLTQPLGKPLEEPAAAPPQPADGARRLFQRVLANISQGLSSQIQRSSEEFYVAEMPGAAGGSKRYVTRLDVVLRSDPFEPESTYTLEVIEVWLRELLPESTAAMGTVRAETYGVTVNARDLATITESDRTRINLLVVVGIFLILLVLVRSPWLAGYLLLTVLFSYYATLGATTLAAHFWSGRTLGQVDWRVPFFLFTILVAVGEDYNILLITRMLKERRRHGPVKGTRIALARTGGTITSCGLIMAGTFATLMLAGLNTLVQIGFALAFGVLLDTFVVRPFLVPAFTVWVWKQQEEGQPPEQPVPFRSPKLYRQAG